MSHLVLLTPSRVIFFHIFSFTNMKLDGWRWKQLLIFFKLKPFWKRTQYSDWLENIFDFGVSFARHHFAWNQRCRSGMPGQHILAYCLCALHTVRHPMEEIWMAAPHSFLILLQRVTINTMMIRKNWVIQLSICHWNIAKVKLIIHSPNLDCNSDMMKLDTWFIHSAYCGCSDWIVHIQKFAIDDRLTLLMQCNTLCTTHVCIHISFTCKKHTLYCMCVQCALCS